VLVVGAFDTAGSPTIKIRISGDSEPREYAATIDTGFTGFVALPLVEMVPLGLTTQPGAASVMLGDGTIIQNLVAQGRVALSGQTADGTVLLDETSNDVLIGMAFLRAFKLALIITETTVILYDGDETLEAVFAFMRTAPQGLPNTSPSASTTTHEVDDE
jgi:predicted aspartyl protease